MNMFADVTDTGCLGADSKASFLLRVSTLSLCRDSLSSVATTAAVIISTDSVGPGPGRLSGVYGAVNASQGRRMRPRQPGPSPAWLHRHLVALHCTRACTIVPQTSLIKHKGEDEMMRNIQEQLHGMTLGPF